MLFESIAFRLFTACVLGALVGFERQLHQRTAGLRTNILVSLGAAGFTMFGIMSCPDMTGHGMARIVAQVVSGIGFLGAGAIMREGLNIHGLNTAATLWCSAALGVFSGAGYYVGAIIFAGFIVLTNTLLRTFENYMERHPSIIADIDVHYVIEIVCSHDHNRDVRETLLRRMRTRHFLLKHMEVKPYEDGQVFLETIFRTKGFRDNSIEQVVEDLSMDPDVYSIEWHVVHNQD